MIRAVIFDCFGVLATGTWSEFCERHFADDETKRVLARDLNRASDGGYITDAEYYGELAMLAGIEPDEVARQLREGIVLNAELFGYVSRLRPDYKIGLLSNVGSDWLYENFTEDQLALFDAKVLSHDSGYVKPDSRAYELIAERLGVQPEECVFVDDMEHNVAGAQAVGMQAVQHLTNRGTINALTTILDH